MGYRKGSAITFTPDYQSGWTATFKKDGDYRQYPVIGWAVIVSDADPQFDVTETAIQPVVLVDDKEVMSTGDVTDTFGYEFQRLGRE